MISINNDKLRNFLTGQSDIILTDDFRKNKYQFSKGKTSPYYTNFRNTSSRYLCSLMIYKGFTTPESVLGLLKQHNLLSVPATELTNFFERYCQFYKSITGRTMKLKVLLDCYNQAK